MLLFFYGEDVFRSRQKTAEIKQKYLASDKSGSGLSSFSFPDNKNLAQKLREVLGMGNLFSSKRLFIVRNLMLEGSVEEQKETLNFLGDNIKKIEDDQDIVVIFWEEGSPKKNNAIRKILEKSARSQNFEKLSGIRLEQWIVKRIKEIDPKGSISNSALSKLIIFCGDETQILENELQKIASYADGKIISERDVENLVCSKIDANIFQTIDALSSGNKKAAFGFLHNHLEKGDDPFYLLSMFVYQFRNLLKVSDLQEKNFPEGEIAKIAKLHPFVVKKSLSQLRKFSFSELKKIYANLLELDRKAKTGELDIKLGLDKFVAEL